MCFIAIVTFLLLSVCNADTNKMSFTLNPDASTVNSIGQIVRLGVLAQNANNLYGADFQLSFDPAVLMAVDNSGNAVSKIYLGSGYSTQNKFVAENKIDNTTGKIDLAVTFLGKTQGISGDAELAYIYFKVKKVAATTIQVDKKMFVVFDQNTGTIVEVQADSRDAALAQQQAQGSTGGIPSSNVGQPTSNTPTNTTNPAPQTNQNVPAVNGNASAFTDIGSSWAKQDIIEAAKLKIISGDGTGKYNPTNKVTRQEFAKIIFNTLGLKAEESSGAAFKDEKQIAGWAKGYVGAISKLGLIKGDNGSFYPEKGLTRYEAAVIFARALGLSEAAEGCDSFKDKADIPDWAKGYVGAVYKKGLIKGMPDGSFSGSDLITRDQAASLVIRFLKLK